MLGQITFSLQWTAQVSKKECCSALPATRFEVAPSERFKNTLFGENSIDSVRLDLTEPLKKASGGRSLALLCIGDRLCSRLYSA